MPVFICLSVYIYIYCCIPTPSSEIQQTGFLKSGQRHSQMEVILTGMLYLHSFAEAHVVRQDAAVPRRGGETASRLDNVVVQEPQASDLH